MKTNHLSSQQATAVVFWTAFESLPHTTRESFLARLLENRKLRCDLMDLAVVENRCHEKTRPFSEYLAARAHRVGCGTNASLKERRAKKQCKHIKS